MNLPQHHDAVDFVDSDHKRSTNSRSVRPKSLYATKYGRMYCGDAKFLLQRYPLRHWQSKVQMVFTSPPFPLNTKKAYGNLQGQDYVDWLASFAPVLADYLTSSGSIVLELGNAWESGRPCMSTLPLKALIAFLEAGSFHLAQEFICFNPARLPTPAQWVTVERIRVKDAFTRIWWMSRCEKPKADNRRVLTSYSESMANLLKRGTYNAGRRPSDHRIGRTSFLNDHGGAIPPNVLVPPVQELLPDLLEVFPISNTSSNGTFEVYCRQKGIKLHPARMPERLVEFFVRFLTDEGDMILDPFAGSNTTGYVAESLKRKWRSIEMIADYASASEWRLKSSRNT